MNRSDHYQIPQEARKDSAWWARCASAFNRVSILWLHKEPEPDHVLATDACLQGFGGTYDNKYFRGRFPSRLKGKNIALLEILAVMVGLKVWGKHIGGTYFWVHVDNEAVATVLNTGASRDIELQNVLREIALLGAQHQFVIKAKHISGVSNRVPDWLSRCHDMGARRQFRDYAKDSSLQQVRVSNELLQLNNQW